MLFWQHKAIKFDIDTIIKLVAIMCEYALYPSHASRAASYIHDGITFFFLNSNTTEEGDISIFLCLLTSSLNTSVYAPSSRQEKQSVVNKAEQKLIGNKLNSTLSLIIDRREFAS